MHKKLEQQIAEQLGGQPFPEAVGPLLWAVSEEYDTLEQKRLASVHDDELHKEHAKLLASVNSLSVGIIILDADYNVFVANNAVMSILEFGGIPASSLRFGDVEGALSCLSGLKEYCAASLSEFKKYELKDQMCNGKHLHIVFSPVVRLEDSTNIIGVVIMIEDISESKALEQSRDEFFSIASHELRTPLTAIRGNASMLLEYYGDKIVDSDMRQMVDDMLVSSERLIKIVNDFLDVSRLEQGRLKMLPESFDIQIVIKKTIEELSDLAKLKGIEIVYEGHDALNYPPVFADPTRVKQVIMNLLGNAIHYSNGGQVVVSEQAVGHYLKISVKDTGVGIAKEQEHFLFRKFQQIGEKIHSRDVMSTGLGLYISRLIVELMGGAIQLEESELGKGSTFSFTLPVAGGM